MMSLMASRDVQNDSHLLSRADYVDAFHKIYEKVNEINKETSKQYTSNILVEFPDLKELHDKIIQSINSYRPKSWTVKINLEQTEGESHTFKDFDSFMSHNTTSPYPTQDIYFQYKFIIYDDMLDKFESYKVGCRVSSKLANIDQLKSSAPEGVAEFLLSFPSNTAGITVEYHDYVKARTFLATFDEWVKGCREAPKNKIANIAKKYSKRIVPIGNLIMIILLGFFTVKSIPESISDINFVLKFIIAYASLFLTVKMVTKSLLQIIKSSIDKYITISYIKMNKGDAKLIDDYTRNNKYSFFSGGVSLICTVLVGLSTSLIYDLIKMMVN